MPVKVEVTFSCLLINKGVCTGSAACLICQVFMLETLPDTKGIFLAWLFTTVKIFSSRTKTEENLLVKQSKVTEAFCNLS